MSVDESAGSLAGPSPSQVRRRAVQAVQAVLSDDPQPRAWSRGCAGGGQGGPRRARAAGLAVIAVELSLQLASALERIAAEQEIAAVDLADVWFLDEPADDQ